MLIPLQEAAAFIHAYHAVFDELWRRRDESLTDADLLLIISSARTEATPPYLLAQLKRLRFLVDADGQAGVWQLASPFLHWLEYLNLHARPVSSAVAQGYLTSLDNLLVSFRLAENNDNLAEGRDILRETRATLRTLVEGLDQTRSAIATAVSEAKSEQHSLDARERFRRINRFWNEYLVPMLQLLDPAGPLEAICAAWERQLAHAIESHFLPELRLAERIERAIQFLRVTVRQSFRECRSELEPLHARLRRDSLWAQGAARILQQVDREGIASSVLASTLPLSSFRFSGHISTAALEASAAVWLELKQPPAIIDFASAGAAAESQAVEDLLAEIDALPDGAFPIGDLLGWLAAEHGSRGFHPVLQVFSLLVTDSRYQAAFHQPISDYSLAMGIVRCGKVTLQIRPIA